MMSCSSSTKVDAWHEETFNGNVKTVITTKYQAEDRQGNLEIGDKVAKFTDKFNENGSKIESSYSYMNYVVSRQKYNYDESGKLVEIGNYNVYNDLTSKTTFNYTEDGKKLEKLYFNEDGEIKATTTYKYDGRELIEESQSTNDGKNYLTKYNVNDDVKGIAGEISYYEQGRLKRIRKHDYAGNLVELIVNKDVDELTILEEVSNYSYEYNKQNDWIKQVEFKNGTPSAISIREISYYKSNTSE